MDQEQQDALHAHAQIETLDQDKILQAALRLFTQKGYFNTSLIDIKQAAGIKTLANVYQHFSSKQAIAEALYANIIDSLNISIDDIRRRSQKSPEQLRAIVDLFFRLTDEAPEVMRFLLLLKTDEFLPAQKPLAETTAFMKIAKIFQGGIKAGEIRNIDPVLLTGHFFGIVNATLCLILRNELDKKADAYYAQTWLSAWNAVANKR